MKISSKNVLLTIVFIVGGADFGHSHHHGLQEYEYRIHEFVDDEDGLPERTNKSRAFTKEELQEWGQIAEKIKKRRKNNG